MSPDDVIHLARKGKLRATKVGKYWQYRYSFSAEQKYPTCAEIKYPA
jgi:hypothetical protein